MPSLSHVGPLVSSEAQQHHAGGRADDTGGTRQWFFHSILIIIFSLNIHKSFLIENRTSKNSQKRGVISQLVLVSAFHSYQNQCSPSSLPLRRFIN